MTNLDAIADPVRLAIIRHLAERGQAALRDLAEAAGVHANTIRPHLLALEQAGLLTRAQRPPAGRGRRPVEYGLTEGWAVSTSGFLGLAELLATLPPEAHDLQPMTEGRRAASRQGRPTRPPGSPGSRPPPCRRRTRSAS